MLLILGKLLFIFFVFHAFVLKPNIYYFNILIPVALNDARLRISCFSLVDYCISKAMLGVFLLNKKRFSEVFQIKFSISFLQNCHFNMFLLCKIKYNI